MWVIRRTQNALRTRIIRISNVKNAKAENLRPPRRQNWASCRVVEQSYKGLHHKRKSESWRHSPGALCSQQQVLGRTHSHGTRVLFLWENANRQIVTYHVLSCLWKCKAMFVHTVWVHLSSSSDIQVRLNRHHGRHMINDLLSPKSVPANCSVLKHHVQPCMTLISWALPSLMWQQFDVTLELHE